MNAITDVTDPESPVRVNALAALLGRQPEVKQVGIGACYSCLTPDGVFIVTPTAAPPAGTPATFESLRTVIVGWSLEMHQIGLVPLALFGMFDDQPTPRAELSQLDAAALFESLAAVIAGAGVDPTSGTCVVIMRRRRPGDRIEAVSVTTLPKCDEETNARLVAAANDWLAPRRSAFQSIQTLMLELSAASCWEAPDGPLDIPEPGEPDLLGMPAAGIA